MASSSLSHQPTAFSGIEPPYTRRKVEESSRVFDVFINHRGPDVKETLAKQLYKSLEELHIEAFLDSEEKEPGVLFTSAIEAAIQSASVQIAIFSKRYAESHYCLAELVLMLQSNARIIPVFYEVEPSHLRHIEKGVYKDAFLEYEKKGRYLNKIKEWKEALEKASHITGYELKNLDSNDCKDILSAVEKEVQRTRLLHVDEHPVGLPELVKKFEDFESSKTNVVGIYGMGGVGKTTLSKQLYNQRKSKYTRSSFLFDVRDACANGRLPLLQSRLLEDLFCERHSFLSIQEGTICLRDRLERNSSFSFLIVLDDIDHVEQLEALLIRDITNKSGNNLVIITTRDVGVLVSAGIDIRHHLEGFDSEKGRELFCWHAFRQLSHPRSDYEDLVQAFVKVCGGLPLSLKVLGRHVSGRPREYWEEELKKVSKTLPRDIMKRLKISFDALDDVQKHIFMDIACFFIDKSVAKAMPLWKASGWSGHHALEALKEKCLVEDLDYKSRSTPLRMHDHLRDLGREMAKELNTPQMWQPRYLETLERKGFQKILDQIKGRCFHSFLDESMGCQITYLLGKPEDGSDTSLLWLELDYRSRRPHDLNSDINSSIPSWIPLYNLQYLRISNGCFRKLWQSDKQAPSYLEELQINDCWELEELRLAHLKYLKKITVGRYIKMKHFVLDRCENLATVNLDFVDIVNLSIRYCPKLKNLTDLISSKCLERITIDRCGNLNYLELNGFEHLKSVSGDFELRQLYISNCPELEELPSLSRLSCLEKIEIISCKKLQNIALPGTLISLSVRRCRKLQRIAGTDDLTKITKLYIEECPELEELPSISRSSCLEQIAIYSCEKLQNIMLPTTLISLYVESCRDLVRVAGTGDLTKLTELHFNKCPVLEEFPSLARLSCLEQLVIDSCEKLQNVSGIEEMHVREYMRLWYCSNAVTRNCIHNLKSVPSGGMHMIGRAMDGAELTLNEHLFHEADIGADAVTEISPLVSESFRRKSKLSFVIGCFVVVVDSSTSVEGINQSLPFMRHEVRKGEWIITMVASDAIGSYYIEQIKDVLLRYGTMKKGFRVDVKKGEEGKSMQLLGIIVDRLHHL